MTRLLCLLILPLLLAACTTDDTTLTDVPGAHRTAETITVTAGDIPESYTTTGTLIADDRVEISSRLIGYIRELRVREGDKVRKGQLLLTIDPTEIEAQLAEARARLAQARAQMEEAQVDFKRYQKLHKQKLVSIDRFQKARLHLRVSRQEAHMAEASVKRVEVQLQYANIRSPVDGVVVKKFKEAGDTATPGAPILAIENPRNTVLRTYIMENHVSQVHVGDRLRIIVDAVGLQVDGLITQVVPSGDPATHSYLVKAQLDRLDGARIGMFARAHFAIGSKRSLLIPEQSLVWRADIPGVYIVGQQGIAHFRMLRTGRHLDGRWEILAGLSSGERIVLKPTAAIHTGNRIIAVTPPKTGS